MADEKSEPERLTMDDLATLRRLLPAARIELERQEREIVQLMQTNERQFDEICRLKNKVARLQKVLFDISDYDGEDAGLLVGKAQESLEEDVSYGGNERDC
jgi:predicted RNase H-like nuclease (RuvC/YqgF family)